MFIHFGETKDDFEVIETTKVSASIKSVFDDGGQEASVEATYALPRKDQSAGLSKREWVIGALGLHSIIDRTLLLPNFLGLVNWPNLHWGLNYLERLQYSTANKATYGTILEST